MTEAKLEHYQQFLQKKMDRANPVGFEKKPARINPMLFPWQRDIDSWALKRGRAALFEDCGLGKTAQQLEWCKSVSDYAGKPTLIVAPLAVAGQTKLEGEKFGYPVTVCRRQEDVKSGINICNYEMLDYFQPETFAGVALDESSILKSYTGTTKRKIVKMFEKTPFKLSCTATPAPNDLMELLNQAEFLGIMKSNEALSCWFIADQKNSGRYRLKKHAEKDFWRWVASWAVCIEKPSDIGCRKQKLNGFYTASSSGTQATRELECRSICYCFGNGRETEKLRCQFATTKPKRTPKRTAGTKNR